MTQERQSRLRWLACIQIGLPTWWLAQCPWFAFPSLLNQAHVYVLQYRFPLWYFPSNIQSSMLDCWSSQCKHRRFSSSYPTTSSLFVNWLRDDKHATCWLTVYSSPHSIPKQILNHFWFLHDTLRSSTDKITMISFSIY